LRNLKAREEERAERRALIFNRAQQLYASPEGILKAQEVVEEIFLQDQVKVHNYEVREILRQDLNLRYRPIKRIAYLANTPRSLILRQTFAKSLTDQLLRGKIVINADETWVNLKDYTRRRWRVRGESNSSSIQAVEPRISLFSAIDTKGTCYFSLTQVNTDKEVKSMFLTHLAEELDKDRPGWREDTVILMDNASYNKNDVTIGTIRKLGMPVMFSASYSYDACPVERHFGYFKQAVILQANKASGKL
jgi:Asp-tRNA(Asn)/Glu-tRNA(Gln) amidotransferase C subunit